MKQTSVSNFSWELIDVQTRGTGPSCATVLFGTQSLEVLKLHPWGHGHPELVVPNAVVGNPSLELDDLRGPFQHNHSLISALLFTLRIALGQGQAGEAAVSWWQQSCAVCKLLAELGLSGLAPCRAWGFVTTWKGPGERSCGAALSLGAAASAWIIPSFPLLAASPSPDMYSCPSGPAHVC